MSDYEPLGRVIFPATDLRDALQALLARYVELVSSGDCGNWDVETEDVVISARAALARTVEE